MSHLFYDAESRHFLYKLEALEEIQAQLQKGYLRVKLEMPNGAVILHRDELEKMIWLDQLPVRLRKLQGENFAPDRGPNPWVTLWEAPARVVGEG